MRVSPHFSGQATRGVKARVGCSVSSQQNATAVVWAFSQSRVKGFSSRTTSPCGCSSQPQPSEHGCEAGPDPILGDLFRVRGFRVSGCGVEIGKDLQGVEAGLFAVSGNSLH